MALPTSRDELVSYVKRKLGDPVITINVSDEQVDDRIEEALRYFQEYHFDGSEKVFLKHQITSSNLIFASASTGTFGNNELIRGATSNVEARVHAVTNATMIHTTYTSSGVSFANGEIVIGTSGAQGTLSTIQLGDIDNQYVPVSNDILSIQHILPFNVGFGATSASSMFSFEYQYIMQNIGNLTTGSVVSYWLTKSHLELLADLFNGTPDVRFNRHVNRLFIDFDWFSDVRPGSWLIVEAIRLLDPSVWPRIWGDRYLADYTTALVKKQWGQNLLKYDGVQMPGGVTLNGQKIYDEGTRELEALEKDIQLKFEEPPHFLIC